MEAIMDIKILTWNARGWKNKKEELSKRVQDYNIIVVTEKKSKNQEKIKFSGYHVLRKNTMDNNMQQEGVVIIVKLNLKIRKVREIYTTSEDIEIIRRATREDTCVCSL